MSHELPLPIEATTDSKSVELIRLWAAKSKLQCVLNIGFWEDQGLDELEAWGTVLADMVHHIANAHHDYYGRSPSETRKIVMKALASEMAAPTTERIGATASRRNTVAKSPKRKTSPTTKRAAAKRKTT